METDLSKLPGKLADTVKEGLLHGLSDEQMISGIVGLGNLADTFVKPDDASEALVRLFGVMPRRTRRKFWRASSCAWPRAKNTNQEPGQEPSKAPGRILGSSRARAFMSKAPSASLHQASPRKASIWSR